MALTQRSSEKSSSIDDKCGLIVDADKSSGSHYEPTLPCSSNYQSSVKMQLFPDPHEIVFGRPCMRVAPLSAKGVSHLVVRDAYASSTV